MSDLPTLRCVAQTLQEAVGEVRKLAVTDLFEPRWFQRRGRVYPKLWALEYRLQVAQLTLDGAIKRLAGKECKEILTRPAPPEPEPDAELERLRRIEAGVARLLKPYLGWSELDIPEWARRLFVASR